MATILDRELRRQITVDGADFTIALDPDGLRLTGKGKRKPEVDLRWRDLLSGEAALAVALNASLSGTRPPPAGQGPGLPGRRGTGSPDGPGRKAPARKR